MAKAYKLKSPKPDPIDELASLHETAGRIESARRGLAEIEANIEALHKTHIAPLEARAAKIREGIEGSREIIRQGLLSQPPERQKLLRGNMTYYIQAGRESVEVLDEGKAIAEVKALGSRVALACINIKETLSKAALKTLLSNPEAPALEHVKLKRSEPALAEKEAREMRG